MPGIEKKPEIAGALVPVPNQNIENGASGEVPQPRQPSNLQGLLRYAMDATRNEDAPTESSYAQMGQERRQFLENALKSMTVNVIELLQKQIEILKNADKIKPDDDVMEYETALDTIFDHVDNIDIANDFHKIGGFTIICPCLKCANPKIRAKTCELLAVLCQSNPYCQQVVFDNELIPELLNIFEKDDDPLVVVKALYALSGIIRNSQEGFNQLIHYNGLTAILRKLEKTEDDKLITKATFLLAALSRTQPDLKSRLIFLDYIPLLITMLSRTRQPSHEHILSLLVSLIEDNVSAVQECRNTKYNLEDTLKKYVQDVRNKEECLEEEEHCRRLLHLLFES